MIEWMEILQYDYVYRALAASIMVGVVCGVLGCFIVLRNMALIGDALSHAILPGVVAGFLIAGHSVFAFFTGAVIAGFVSALIITWIQNNLKTKNDAAIGIVFSAMFAIGVIGISWLSRQEGVHIDLKDFLFGNVLGIAMEDLMLNGVITLFVVGSLAILYRYLLMSTFQPKVATSMGISVNTLHYFLMLLLSLVVVSALQSVGVILVVAMLIIPASTANLLTNRLNRMLWIAGTIGVLSAVFGLVISIILETTPGPVMTLFATTLYLLAVLFSPQKGIIVSRYRKYLRLRKIYDEDVLKAVVKLSEQKDLNISAIAKKIDSYAAKVKSALDRLSKEGFISQEGEQIEVLRKGSEYAYQMIRKHRLWETYLVEKMGMQSDQIHDEAEKLEHVLPEAFIDELEASLGFPKMDPHGSPIPQKKGKLGLKLINLEADAQAIVTTHQLNDQIALDLWKQGLTPNVRFTVIGEDEYNMKLLLGDRPIEVDKEIAQDVKVALI